MKARFAFRVKGQSGICFVVAGAKSKSWAKKVAEVKLDRQYGIGGWSFA